MRPGIKAFLLSAFVFPGLGQLYNQDRKKGVILVLGTNLLLGLLLLVGMVLLSQEYLSVFYPRPLTREMFRLLLLDTLTHPFFLVPFGLFLALWGFAALDAARSAGRAKAAGDH
jgi:Na+-driven multidrug efflux pump